MSKNVHHPVMLREVVDCLEIKSNGCYIDATFGRGGHSRAILDRLGPNGRLIVFDKDQEAVEYARSCFAGDPRVKIYHACFSQMRELLADDIDQVDGILVDLGVSSVQLDDPKRGFSFRHAASLDMRMDHRQKETAATWLAKASKKELAFVLKKYGEEIDAHRIAEKIIARRALEPIKTTEDLSDVIQSSKTRHRKRIHPATQSFQAIRIHINQELKVLESFLKEAPQFLKGSGVIAILSFHSLEDRMVKRCFKRLVIPNIPKKLPIEDKAIPRQYAWRLKRMHPSLHECQLNPRSRSAVLRAIMKG